MSSLVRVSHEHRSRRGSRNSLSPLCKLALAARQLPWFALISSLCLSPLAAMIFILSLPKSSSSFLSGSLPLYDTPMYFDETAFSIVVAYAYVIIIILAAVSYHNPALLCLQRLLPSHTRYRRDHAIFIRQRNLRQLIKGPQFTIFVLGAHSRSVPLLVTKEMTISEVFAMLWMRRLLPTRYHITHLLHMSHRQLRMSEALGDLRIGPLSHLTLKVRVCGGFGRESVDSEEEDRGFATPPPKKSKTAAPASNISTPPTTSHVLDSPSKNTRARTSQSQAGTLSQPIAVIDSPTKKRKNTKKDKFSADLDAWMLSDSEIIRRSRETWKSKAYDHYDISLVRHLTATGAPHHMSFKFTCRSDPAGHKDQFRDRMATSHGTRNLQRSADACNVKRGVSAGEDTSKGAQQTLMSTVSQYTPARHRALVALRCASSYRPFNSVHDPFYVAEVELLRPGTKPPSSSTVSRDVRLIYAEGSKSVREYFKTIDNGVHIVMDGWTAPFIASYLGIVVIWYSEGRIWRSILEFIRLKEKHTGEYLAQVTAECLKRFGLDKKIHTLCMDNASNCDKAASVLKTLVPTFRGTESRTRCFPHTVNLIAKAFISFFFRQPAKPKAPPKVASGVKRKHAKSRAATASTWLTDPPVIPGTGEEEATAPPEPTLSAAEQDLEAITLELADRDTEEVQQSGAIDDAKSAHDDAVVRSIRQQAISTALNQFGLVLLSAEETMALGVFPKVAGLARRLHDSPTLQEKFERLVDASAMEGQKRTLDRRVPTRWNSDYVCLMAHIRFEVPIRQLTSGNDLKAYALTEEQWKLAKQLAEVLEIFMEITNLFEQAEVPLVYKVIPIIEQMEHQLQDVRDAAGELPDVIRIAAQAALLVVEKYYALTDENEVYRIAIAMCPDRKLEWFNKNEDWRQEDRVEVDRLVRHRWNETYAPKTSVATEGASVTSEPVKARSRWASAHREADSSSYRYAEDTIEGYLSSPPVTPDVIRDAGGVLKYWEQAKSSRPCLARMALDFLSAPASSVDAERSFSSGRLTVNHLQHNMSSQSFKAQVAVGSWIKTPLLSDVKVVARVIEAGNKAVAEGGGKGKAKANDSI